MNSGKRHSHLVTDGPSRAPARAMMKAVGFSDADLAKPLIGIANTWTEIGPCNFHLRELAEQVKAGVRAAGGTPLEFNTVSISDGITMGTEGMKTSLISRELIADSIELVARGNSLDGLVCLSACDKTNPGVMMALARLDLPGLALYGDARAAGSGVDASGRQLGAGERVANHRAARKPRTRSAVRTGSSSIGTWPSSGKTTSRLPAMSRANRSAYVSISAPWRTFTATASPVRLSRARYTRPLPPDRKSTRLNSSH